MKILAIGDIVSDYGIDMLHKYLSKIKKDNKIDFVIANGENASELGIIPSQADEMLSLGVDVITLGNHAFKKNAIYNYLDDSNYILRPQNFAPHSPGRGYGIYNVLNYKVLVINLIGRTNMEAGPDNPFLAIEKILKDNDGEYDIAICDFHAQATSEKYAMAFHTDGKLSALYGTHTHVQTNDARIFDNGLGYVSDLGMTGPYNSVIGVRPEHSIAMFRGDMQEKFKVAEGKCFLNGAVFTINEDTKKCEDVKLITIMGD